MKSLILISALILTILPTGANPLDTAVDRVIDRTIPLISTDRLAAEMKMAEPPILLDTRALEEFAVSHLPGAVRVGFGDFDSSKLPAAGKNSRIVLYCSIGFRSEKIGEKLMAAGYTNVRNLYGGIFAWANDGRNLVKASGKRTETVHGYNRKWSMLLDPHIPRTLAK